MLPNIIFIGFMGSGKSSVGRHVAGMTGHRFLDTDDLVSQKAKQDIPSIFAAHGEEYFRDLETGCLKDLVGICGVVLATGGGLILREENRALLKKIGVTVWLDAEPDVIFERVSRNSRRPLLATENPRETFDRLRQARLPTYEAASDFRVDSTGLTHAQAAKCAIEGIRRTLNSRPRG